MQLKLKSFKVLRALVQALQRTDRLSVMDGFLLQASSVFLEFLMTELTVIDVTETVVLVQLPLAPFHDFILRVPLYGWQAGSAYSMTPYALPDTSILEE